MTEQNEAMQQERCHQGHHKAHHHFIGFSLGMVMAAAIFGLFIWLSVGRAKSYDRSVSVRGVCEREVKADRAIYPLSFKEMGDDLTALNARVEASNKTICDFLKASGIEESEISVSTPKLTDNYANSYSSHAPTRYVMTSVVTIYSTNVDKVLDIQKNLSKLLEKGIAIGSGESWENPVQFLFEGLNEIKPEMIASANASAREAAEQFAKDSHSRLGKIRTATQGYFTIEDRDSNTPHIKKVRVVTNVDYYLR